MPQTSQEKLARDRVSYAKRRLRELRTIYPELPVDILERTNLRTLTYAVHRVRRCQTSLKPTPRNTEQTTPTTEEVRSDTQFVGQA